MAYNEEIDTRVHEIVSGWENREAKKMFGGVCHLLNGNMFCGVNRDFLILRLGQENAERALESLFVRPFDLTGRPMKGWVMVEGEGFATDDELRSWLEAAAEFTATLPPK